MRGYVIKVKNGEYRGNYRQGALNEAQLIPTKRKAKYLLTLGGSGEIIRVTIKIDKPT